MQALIAVVQVAITVPTTRTTLNVPLLTIHCWCTILMKNLNVGTMEEVERPGLQPMTAGSVCVEDLWRKRRRKGQKKGDKIGFCNADRLQADENGIAALCTYLVKQGCGKKRWNSSHNLERPYSRTNDGKYNRRQIEKWAKEHPPREFWEKKYPGWTLTDDDYGVQYEYNDFTGWAVYLKLRKKE